MLLQNENIAARSSGLLGSTLGFRPGYFGSVPSLRITSSFLTSQIRITMLIEEGPPMHINSVDQFMDHSEANYWLSDTIHVDRKTRLNLVGASSIDTRSVSISSSCNMAARDRCIWRLYLMEKLQGSIRRKQPALLCYR